MRQREPGLVEDRVPVEEQVEIDRARPPALRAHAAAGARRRGARRAGRAAPARSRARPRRSGTQAARPAPRARSRATSRPRRRRRPAPRRAAPPHGSSTPGRRGSPRGRRRRAHLRRYRAPRQPRNRALTGITLGLIDVREDSTSARDLARPPPRRPCSRLRLAARSDRRAFAGTSPDAATIVQLTAAAACTEPVLLERAGAQEIDAKLRLWRLDHDDAERLLTGLEARGSPSPRSSRRTTWPRRRHA